MGSPPIGREFENRSYLRGVIARKTSQTEKKKKKSFSSAVPCLGGRGTTNYHIAAVVVVEHILSPYCCTEHGRPSSTAS